MTLQATPQVKFLLVGTQFSQGAPALLAAGLPQGARVELRADPTNPYDPLAVRVYALREEVKESPALEEALAGHALALAALEWPFPLGHLGANEGTKAAKLARSAGLRFFLAAEWHNLPEATRAEGRLVFEGSGAITIATGPGEARRSEGGA